MVPSGSGSYLSIVNFSNEIMKNKLLIGYYEPQRSGQTTHVLNLVRGLNKNKFDVTLVLPSHLFQNQSEFSQLGIRIVPLPMRKLLWDPKAISNLVRMLHEEEFDIVHVHSQEAGIIVRIISRLAGVKSIVYTPQCTNIRHTNLFRLYREVEKLLSYFTNIIISVSEHDRERIIQWGISPSKVITIHNGIESQRNNVPNDVTAKFQSFGLDAHAPLVMQVGRLSHQKNPLMFIEGASRIINQIPDCQFVLIGDGPLKYEVERYIQDLGIKRKIFCLGWQENANELMAQADIITLTSRWEGLPHVLLEAMLCSKPIVTTQVNGCSELVIHGVTGYVVPTNNVDLWVEYVLDLLQDHKKSTKMGELGNARLKQEFSLQQMISKIEVLYDKLITDSNSN